MSIARGIAYTVTGGYPIGSLPDSYKFLGLGYIAGIPTPIVLMVVLAALTIFFLNKTVVGRWIYAIGGNEEGARISGVRVNRVKRLVYSLSGLMAAISGIAMAARLGVGQSTAGQSYEMDAIAATVIGGASLSGRLRQHRRRDHRRRDHGRPAQRPRAAGCLRVLAADRHWRCHHPRRRAG